MTAVTQVDPAAPAGSTGPLSRRRPLGDRAFQILSLAAGLLVLVILVLIAVTTSQQAGREREDLEGAVAERPPPGQGTGGSGRSGRIHLRCSGHDDRPI